MNGFAFRDRQIAETLKRMAKERKPQKGVDANGVIFTPKCGYLCLADGDIPAAILSGGVLTLGKGSAYILWRDTTAASPESWEDNQAAGTPEALAVAEEDATPITIPVWNHSPQDIKSYGSYSAIDEKDKLFFVQQDPFGDFHIIDSGNDIIRIELYDNLTLDGTSATAYIMDGDDVLDENTITVYDTIGKWAGLGRDGETPGYQGWAVWMEDAARYEILFLEGPARWVEFTLTEDMGYTTSGEASASVEYFWGWNPNGRDPDTPITVSDTQNHFADKVSGDKGIAVWDELRNLHVITKMETSGKVYWGKVYTAPTGTPPTGEVYPCDDAEGANPEETAIDVIFPEIAGATCVIVADDVIAYAVAADGTYVCVSDYSVGGAAQYAMATQQWTDEDAPYVICQVVADPDSVPEEGADDITVYLPRTCPLDPNVSMGAILAVAPDGNGDYVCVTDYLDGVICEVKMVGNITTPEGWADMDGSANAGGSGMDMRGLFPRAWGANERTEDEIEKTDGYTIGDYSGDGSTGGNDNITLDDHGTAGETGYPFSGNDYHPINDPAHEEFDNRPAFGVLKFIERMDNSMGGYMANVPPDNVEADDPRFNRTLDDTTDDLETLGGATFAQLDDDKQLDYAASYALLNDEPAAIGGSGNYMTSTNWGAYLGGADALSDYTIYGVVTHETTASGGANQSYILTSFGATSTPWHPWYGLVVNATDADSAYIRLTLSNSNGTYTSHNGPTRNFVDGTKKKFIFCMRQVGGAFKIACEALTDETTNAAWESTLDLATYEATMDEGTYLAYSPRSPGNFLVGAVGGLWLYDSAHSDAVVTATLNYLISRFGAPDLS